MGGGVKTICTAVAENGSALVPMEEGGGSLVIDAPIVSSYNDRIRPLLDCIDKLRNLKVMQEGIQLPTIVVVGDQSSGKSSVLESLAGINLPRGQGICTRVPLIMRLQSHDNPQQAEMTLEFNGKVVSTDEDSVADAIILATDEIAGRSKGISNTPLTLTVKKNGVPDLTMVDLPGITRVPVHGQPEDIYEQISTIIMEYIKPEESIILNVLSATVDFSTCESIRMSQKVDKTGERTLAVVTKPDKAPEGLYEKVTADDVNIGLGYVVVRNRIGDESYEDAREEEAILFETHPLLSSISKSIIGIPVLAHKLVQIQATIISKCFPDIVRKINDKLNSDLSELKKMPRKLTSAGEAMRVFWQILSSATESLKKIFIWGKFDEFPDDKQRHCTARIAEMLTHYANMLQKNCIENEPKEDFLMPEIKILEESEGIWLADFLPRGAFVTLKQTKVNSISSMPVEFLKQVWKYVEGVVVPILLQHSDGYPQLQSCMRRAAQNLIAKEEEKTIDWCMEIIQMEKLVDYTCHPEYISTLNKLMTKQEEFMQIINDHSSPSSTTMTEPLSFGKKTTTQQWELPIIDDHSYSSTIIIDGFGEIDVEHLYSYGAVVLVKQAYDLKMRMTSYWKVVLRRLVDSMALQISFSIQNMMNNEMEVAIMNEFCGPDCTAGLERMLQESPIVAEKRMRLIRSINLLRESRGVVAKIMDRIADAGD